MHSTGRHCEAEMSEGGLSKNKLNIMIVYMKHEKQARAIVM